ncbi:MAG: LytR/AlgR family response regulator transcription factor [Lachnospiraceae bacterium]
MEISICDDSAISRQKTASLVKKYYEEHGETVHINSFHSGTALLSHLKSVNYCADIIFLDIIMPDMTGIEVAGALRKANCPSCIVLVSTSADFAVDSYPVEASYYLVKPVSFQDITTALERCHTRLSAPVFTQTLTITNNRRTLDIPQISIHYIEVFNQVVTLHCRDGSYETYTTLEGLSALLNPNIFLRLNRSFIVNLYYIETMQGRDITLKNGIIVTVSRQRMNTVKKAFFSFLSTLTWDGSY